MAKVTLDIEWHDTAGHSRFTGTLVEIASGDMPTQMVLRINDVKSIDIWFDEPAPQEIAAP